MRTRRRKILLVVGISAIAIALMNASKCDSGSTATAATAVNKYAVALSAVQDAEIKWHGLGKVSDAEHIEIQKDLSTAAVAGHQLDTAISLAASGADASGYIKAAQNAFADLSVSFHLADPNAQAELTALVQTAGDILQNSISLIQQIKAGTPVAPAPKPSPAVPSGLAIFMALGLIGMAGTFDLAGALQLLTAATQLEPIAFSLILQLSQSLKGKSAEEIVALNETLFGKVESTAAAEIAAANAAAGNPAAGAPNPAE